MVCPPAKYYFLIIMCIREKKDKVVIFIQGDIANFCQKIQNCQFFGFYLETIEGTLLFQLFLVEDDISIDMFTLELFEGR